MEGSMTRPILACLVALIGITAAHGQPIVLKGLTGVNVGVLVDDQVEKQHPELRDAIQRDAEIKLRIAGMQVLSDSDLISKPRIVISISRTSLGVFGIMLAFGEPAFLERDRATKIQATTWLRDGVALSIDDTNIRGMIKDMVDIFLNDWLIVNPKAR
jgi:hypothetical protein